MSNGEGRYCPNCNASNSVVEKQPGAKPVIYMCVMCEFEDPPKSFPREVERKP